MKIEIRQHKDDVAMYELWQLADGKPKYLMAIVHEDALDCDIIPSTYDETRINATISIDH